MSSAMPSARHLIALFLLAAASAFVRAEVVDIDNETLAGLLEEGVAVVDIRRPDEWAETGVIEGSHRMTFFDAQGAHDAPAWRRRLDAIVSEEEPVVLICRSGNRTGLVTRWLSEREGFATVYNVTDGIMGWKDDGGATVPVP